MDNKKEIIDLMLKKLNKETDLSWREINNNLGLNYSDSHIRKMSYGVKLYDDYVQNQKLKNVSCETLWDINEKIIELRKEKVKLCDLRTQVNKEIREQARFENILDLLRNEISKINKEKPLEENNIIFKPGEKQMVIALSDIHYGLEVDNKWNKYNVKIARDRMLYLVSRAIDIANTHKVNMINVVVLGDEIAGHLHLTSRLENSESTTEQLIGVSELISEALNILANNVKYISVGFVCGNHSRVFADKNQNTNKDYLTSLVKEFIKLRIGHRDNIIILDNTISNDILTLNILGNEIACVHGHNDKMGTCIDKLTRMLGYSPDFVFMGHIHHIAEDSIGRSEVVVSGSFAGTDEYAVSLRLHSKPMQKIMVFSKEYGREATYNIDLSKS